MRVIDSEMSMIWNNKAMVNMPVKLSIAQYTENGGNEL